MTNFAVVVAVFMAFAGTACAAPVAKNDPGSLERQAERFVTLSLSLAQAHPEEIDAYFGPPRLDTGATSRAPSLTTLRREVGTLLVEIEASRDGSARRAKLRDRVRALSALLEILDRPNVHDFEAETLLVYSMMLPAASREKFSRARQTLEKLLPGPGTLASRVAAYRARFVVPPERRKAVFERALSECRSRTLAKWRLPAEERLHVEWTREVDAAWHRYDGRYRSTLRLNPAAVAYLSSAIDVACHEGYPGHHAQFVVMEARARNAKSAAKDTLAVGDTLDVEDTVVLLRSPISMLREGAANYGVGLAFSAAERAAFERDVLFPLAGLDPAQAEQYAAVNRLVDELSANVADIVRDYRDKRLSSEAARRALESTALVSSPAPLLSFVDRFGPYVLGYTVARDKVDAYIHIQMRSTGADPWDTLRDVLEYSKVALLR